MLCYRCRGVVLRKADSCDPFFPPLGTVPYPTSPFGNPCSEATPLIARFLGPTWGPSGADRTQVGPMLATLTSLSGTYFKVEYIVTHLGAYTFHRKISKTPGLCLELLDRSNIDWRYRHVRRLLNFKAIWWFQLLISRLRHFLRYLTIRRPWKYCGIFSAT